MANVKNKVSLTNPIAAKKPKKNKRAMPIFDNKLVVIQAQSSGFEGENFAKITINNVKVQVEINENCNNRGLHVVTINPKNGKIETAQVFDTYKSSK